MSDPFDCHGGPGTTEEACGACITCLNRILEQRDSQIQKLQKDLEESEKLRVEYRDALKPLVAMYREFREIDGPSYADAYYCFAKRQIEHWEKATEVLS